MNNNFKAKFSPYDIDHIGNNGELQRALDIALEQIRNGSHDSNLYFVAAKIAFDLQNLPKAEQLIKLLLASDPDHINGWILYGNINAQKGDNHRSAYGLKRAEEIFPGLAQINIVRELSRPQPPKKIEEMADRHAISETSFDTATFAEICVKQGYLTRALKIYKDLKSKSPGNIDFEHRIEEIKRKIEKND
jgi:tetratricopeptide (TPR) repeat protein